MGLDEANVGGAAVPFFEQGLLYSGRANAGHDGGPAATGT